MDALAVSGVVKSFAGVRALRGVDLSVRTGEVHALLGENGAGKSTLIKVLAGVHRPDAGTVEVGGQPLPEGFGPGEATAAGLRFVHQDLGLVDALPVFENIAFQTGFARRFGLIDDAGSVAAARTSLATLGADIDPRTPVGDLPQAEKTIVALARAMQGDARVIVLDEVTASLPTPDAARIHASVRTARDRGVGFVYVSHRMEEVFDLCDRLTVFADGGNVATAAVTGTDLDEVVRWIAGKAVARGRTRRTAAPGALRLAGRALAGDEIATPVSLAVRAGEIVGLTGIRGSGYDRLCRWLAGIDRPATGAVEIDGAPLGEASPAVARAAGCDTVLGDRAQVAFADLTLAENLFPDAPGGRGPSAEAARAAALLGRFGVRPAGDPGRAMAALSGGNQQKVLFARALDAGPRVLVLIDPTAGVDIGARAELHALVRAAADAGTAVLYGSSDFEEIAAVADRAVVVRPGGAAAEIAGPDLGWDRLFREAHAGAAHVH